MIANTLNKGVFDRMIECFRGAPLGAANLHPNDIIPHDGRLSIEVRFGDARLAQLLQSLHDKHACLIQGHVHRAATNS